MFYYCNDLGEELFKNVPFLLLPPNDRIAAVSLFDCYGFDLYAFVGVSASRTGNLPFIPLPIFTGEAMILSGTSRR